MDYDTWLSDSPLEFRKKLLSSFIGNTISYARDHLNKRITELGNTPADDLTHRLDRMQKWLAYIEFQEHTMEELKGDKVDNLIPGGQGS